MQDAYTNSKIQDARYKQFPIINFQIPNRLNIDFLRFAICLFLVSCFLVIKVLVPCILELSVILISC